MADFWLLRGSKYFPSNLRVWCLDMWDNIMITLTASEIWWGRELSPAWASQVSAAQAGPGLNTAARVQSRLGPGHRHIVTHCDTLCTEGPHVREGEARHHGLCVQQTQRGWQHQGGGQGASGPAQWVLQQQQASGQHESSSNSNECQMSLTHCSMFDQHELYSYQKKMCDI